MKPENIIIYGWIGFLILAIVASILFSQWDRKPTVEAYSSCVDCCSSLNDVDFSACNKKCRILGNPCDCCMNSLRNKKQMDIFGFIKPTATTEEVVKILPVPKPLPPGKFDTSGPIKKISNTVQLPYSIVIPG